MLIIDATIMHNIFPELNNVVANTLVRKQLNTDRVMSYAARLNQASNSLRAFNPSKCNGPVPQHGAKSLSMVAQYGLSCGPLIKDIINDCNFAKAQHTLGTDAQPGIIKQFTSLEQFLLIMEIMRYFPSYQDRETFSLYLSILRTVNLWRTDSVNNAMDIHNKGIILSYFCRHAIKTIPDNRYEEFFNNTLSRLKNLARSHINNIVPALAENFGRFRALHNAVSAEKILTSFERVLLSTLRCDREFRITALKLLQQNVPVFRGEQVQLASHLLTKFREMLTQLNVDYIDNENLSEVVNRWIHSVNINKERCRLDKNNINSPKFASTVSKVDNKNLYAELS